MIGIKIVGANRLNLKDKPISKLNFLFLQKNHFKMKITQLKPILLTIIFLTITFLTFSQNQGTEIRVKFKNLKNSECYLGFHYGNNKYIKDTATVDSKGMAVFKSENALLGGIYLIIIPSRNYFELVVSEPLISVETDTSDFIESMKIIESEENKEFYGYMSFMKESMDKRNELDKKIQAASAKNDEKAKKEYEAQKDELNDAIIKYRKDLVEQKPDLFWSKIVYAMQEPEPREKLENEADTTYGRYIYNFYQLHYFDHIDFSDNRFLRTPIYEGMVLRYMDKLTMRHPDSIKFAAARVIDKTLADTELFKYTLVKLFNKYAQSKYMGMDAVFVFLAERYYLSGKAYWSDSTQLAKIWERVYKLSSNLIGMKARNLEMEDTGHVVHSLYDVDSRYTVVIFWDPECGHCKKELPVLKKLYNMTDRDSLEVFAVYVGTDLKSWRKFIKENNHSWISVADPENKTNFRMTYDVFSTPVIYLLNNKKIIEAKRIAVEDIDRIINSLEGKPVPKQEVDKTNENTQPESEPKTNTGSKSKNKTKSKEN